ncbi:MAG: diguanylate cyclase, partial [Gammaproteobacteria bacterium]|nr:diguanylate cyclase [Gammaproteobacteria bacterium]
MRGLAPSTPIVVLSGQRDAEFEAEVLEAGAQDYLVKGEFDSEYISRAIRHARTRARLEARLKLQDAEIRQLAFYDALTKLPNRRLLLDRLQQALAASGRNHRAGALLFIDLDDFKGLNDTLGHDVGDLLLIQVAQRLVECVREGDTVSRLGGDEFVVMLEDLSGSLEEAVLQAEAVGEKIIAALNRPYDLNGNEQRSTPSIGITLFNTAHDSIDDLLKRADLAMYQAKEAGRNTLRFFDHAMQARVEARAVLDAELRCGMRAGQFLLHYQPQVDG